MFEAVATVALAAVNGPSLGADRQGRCFMVSKLI
jgi:hypothetical protein